MKLRDFFRRPSDRDRFAQIVISRAARRGWPHKIVYDRDEFVLNVGGPKGMKFFLQNTYSEWLKAQAEGRSREGEVDQLISAMFEAVAEDETLEAALPHVLPVIRNRRELECYCVDPALNMEFGQWDSAYQPLCQALAVGVAIDRPSSLMVLDSKQLRHWGVPFARLLDRAISNLREKSPTLFERQPDGFYVSQYDDQYDCSRLLLPEIFGLLPLKGEPVAIAVARQGMVVAGSEDTNALLAMARFAEEQIEKATRPTSYLPIVWSGGAWSVFDPAEPELEPLRDLRAKQMLWDNENQREVLQAHYAKTGRELFVGKIQAHKFNGNVYTFATWAQSVETLLPRVDAVAVCRVDGRWVLRSWEDFWLVCGDLLVDEGCYPTRFRTPHSMSNERLERLESGFNQPTWLPTPENQPTNLV